MNRKIISIIVLIVVILSLAFYWFQLRPSQIRKECSTNLIGTGFSSLGQSLGQREANYNNCLRKMGLEK